MGRCTYVVFAGSLLLHLAVFWPEALPPTGRTVTPLMVRLVPTPVAESDTPLSGRPEGEPPLRRVMTSDDAELAGGRRALPQVVSGSRQAAMERKQGRAGNGAQLGGLKGDSSEADWLVQHAPFVSDSERGNAVLVGRYRLALAGAAIRLLQASGEAFSGGLEGRSVIIVQVMPGGGFPDVRIEESSGARVLDERALALVRRAVLEVPAPLQGQPFYVVLPVLFEAM